MHDARVAAQQAGWDEDAIKELPASVAAEVTSSDFGACSGLQKWWLMQHQSESLNWSNLDVTELNLANLGLSGKKPARLVYRAEAN